MSLLSRERNGESIESLHRLQYGGAESRLGRQTQADASRRGRSRAPREGSLRPKAQKGKQAGALQN